MQWEGCLDASSLLSSTSALCGTLRSPGQAFKQWKLQGAQCAQRAVVQTLQPSCASQGAYHASKAATQAVGRLTEAASRALEGAEVDRGVQLSCGEHSDYGLLTLVNQEQHIPALQVRAVQGHEPRVRPGVHAQIIQDAQCCGKCAFRTSEAPLI